MAKQKFKSTIGSNKQQKKLKDTMEMLRIADQVKMVTFYVLRNQGWGAKRLDRFNKKWNEYFIDISMGLFTIEDIMQVLKDETGLNEWDLMIKAPEEEK